MKAKSKLLLILFLITWSALAVLTFINHSHNYLFKSYFDAGEFQSSRDEFINGLGQYVLAPFDAEKAKEQLSVTQQEIENYRNYYSSTIDSDEVIEKKLLPLKEQIIDQYAKEQVKNQNEFLKNYKYFSYNLVNVVTEEKFSKGQQLNSDLYREKFGENHLTLSVDSSVNVDTYPDFYNSAIEQTYTTESSETGDQVTLHNYVDYTQIIELPIEIAGEVMEFEGTISVPKAMLSDLHNATGAEYKSFVAGKYIFYLIWLTGILAIVGLFTFIKPPKGIFKGQFEKLHEIYSRIPIDVQVILLLITAMVAFATVESLGHTLRSLFYYGSNLLPLLIDCIMYFLVLLVSVFAVIMGAIWTWDSVNTEEKMKKQVQQAMLYRLADGMRDIFLNRSVGMQTVAILVITFLSGIGFVGAAMFGQELVVIYILLFFFIALPATLVFLRRMGYLNRIMKQTEEMAAGRLTTEIKVKGKSVFAKHAANLNDLREGVRNSMTEQAKSERMKTELITNVSHDLRTPLTSIITYTDLLKNPNLTEEERKQYIDVLDKKSARLKTLIEDLFEVSKMASGNIEITKQRLDLTQLLKQSIGEHEEEFAKSNFDLRVLMPEQPLFAYVDGQKMWRVIDNLIVNALKYSLEGTRIYITLKQSGSSAEFTVKNISKYELDENVDELTERFKRADASRHTDGSGLGLAIAQSIADLHNGRLSIDVDGDLFKVTVSVPAEY